VASGLFEQMSYLRLVSDCHMLRGPSAYTEWCLRASAVSVAEAMISAMDGYGPAAPRESPAPSLLFHPSAPMPCAPLVRPFMVLAGSPEGGRGAAALIIAL
jgi:hypothetical protein